MQVTLTRYWFEFDADKDDWRAKMGCGVTAYNYEDAVYLLGKYQFNGETIPPIIKVIDNIDVSTLDANHVLPNVSTPPNLRGIWWPYGIIPVK